MDEMIRMVLGGILGWVFLMALLYFFAKYQWIYWSLVIIGVLVACFFGDDTGTGIGFIMGVIIISILYNAIISSGKKG